MQAIEPAVPPGLDAPSVVLLVCVAGLVFAIRNFSKSAFAVSKLACALNG